MFGYLEKIPKSAQYVLCGSLLGLGFVYPVFWLVVFLGIALFFYITLSEKNISSVLFLGWLVFTIKALWVNSFFLNIKPSSWIDDGWFIGVVLIASCWVLVSAVIGLSGLFLAGVISVLGRYLNIIYLALLAPFLWVISEILGSLLFSILTYGSGSSINANYSFGYIGYLLSEHQLLLATTSFGGVYILSFMVTFTSFGLYYFYTKTNKKLFLITILILLSVLVITDEYNVRNVSITNSEGISIAILDTKFSADMRSWPNLNEFIQKEVDEAMIVALKERTDYILLPEGVDINEEKLQNYLPKIESWPIIIGNSIAETEQDGLFLRANVYKDLSKVASVDKQYLVPVGEYMPMILGVTLRIFGLDSDESFLGKRDFVAGPLFSQENFTKDFPAVLFCFDGAVPQSVKNILESHPSAPFVAYPISHAWFENSKTLENQIDMMMKIQAVYNQVDIISAGNMVDGALYTKFGKKINPIILTEKERWRVGVVNF